MSTQSPFQDQHVSLTSFLEHLLCMQGFTEHQKAGAGEQAGWGKEKLFWLGETDQEDSEEEVSLEGQVLFLQVELREISRGKDWHEPQAR